MKVFQHLLGQSIPLAKKTLFERKALTVDDLGLHSSINSGLEEQLEVCVLEARQELLPGLEDNIFWLVVKAF